MALEIVRTSRYASHMGRFSEHLVCYWLSRSGFEVAIVDQIGFDVTAYNRASGERLGITVKSRTRLEKNPTENVYVFRTKKERQEFRSICADFLCEPWIAVYFEVAASGDLYLTPTWQTTKQNTSRVDRRLARGR